MNEQAKESGGLWDDAEIISVYTRAQALEDGVLVDISELAREAGFKFPVAVTQGVWGVLNPSKELEAEGQSWKGRAWDMLTILRLAIRGSSRTDEVCFAPLFIMEPGQKATPCSMRGKCGPDDQGEPVITLMLPNDD